MKLSVQPPASVGQSVWRLPACYVIAAMALQYAFFAVYHSPSFADWQFSFLFDITSLMAVFTAGFWVTLRLIYRQLNSAILGYLLDTNHLSRMSFFRKRAMIRLRNQALFAVLPTCALWLFQFQGVFPNSASDVLDQLASLMFWFSMTLFVLQSWSLPQFIYKYFLRHIPESVVTISQQKQLTGVLRNVLMVNVATVLVLPVFMLLGQYLALPCLLTTVVFCAVVLHTLAVMVRAGHNGAYFVQQAINRIEKKQYYLKRKSKHREDALRHAHKKLEGQKQQLRQLPVSLLSARLVTLLVACCFLLVAVWRFTAI